MCQVKISSSDRAVTRLLPAGRNHVVIFAEDAVKALSKAREISPFPYKYNKAFERGIVWLLRNLGTIVMGHDDISFHSFTTRYRKCVTPGDSKIGRAHV